MQTYASLIDRKRKNQLDAVYSLWGQWHES